jgi:hypothetical protein
MDQCAWMYHCGVDSVSLHSAAASSLYWAYEQFLENHASYDRCIFIVTSTGRLPVNSVKEIGSQFYHIANYDSAFNLLKTKSAFYSFETKKWLEAALGYYIFLQNPQYDVDIAELMIAKIRQLRPDTMIVPIIDYANNLEGLVPLNEYRRIMFDSIDSSKTPLLMNATWTYKESNCICHVSKEMNQLIAQDMQTALATGIWDPKLPKYVPHSHGLDWYYDLNINVEMQFDR